jgi:methylaspartate ammonia-lyase
METHQAQLETLSHLRASLAAGGWNIQVMVDEWCIIPEDMHAFAQAGACDLLQIKMPDLGTVMGTIEAIRECKRFGVGAYVGGSCNETVQCTQISAGVALATQADQLLAKPDMGVEDALTVVKNEMARVLMRVHQQVGTDHFELGLVRGLFVFAERFRFRKTLRGRSR